MQVQIGTQNLRHQAMAEYVVPQVELLYRVALALTHQPADAEDLVQETLLRAFKAIDGFDGQHPRAWLLTILRNTNINRARRKRPEILSDLHELPDAVGPSHHSQSPETIMIDQSFDPAIARAFRALPQRLQDVVRLVDIDGLSYEEAASLLSIPIGTVMSRLHRARIRMRKALSANGYVVSGRTNEILA